MALDPDDPRPPYIQVAHDLRAQILTRQVTPGERLASGSTLAKHYGVARMTVQQAVRILRDEGLVVSRQGSGVFVRARTERPVGLRPHLERAFEADKVSIDFAGFSAETLAAALGEPLDKVRAGRLTVSSLRVRILVLDATTPWILPCRADNLADDPAFRARAADITSRSIVAITHAMSELAEMGLIGQASAEVRTHAVAPTFKLYVINEREAFFGFYPVSRHAVTLNGEQHEICDLMGKDTTLFHHGSDDPDSLEGQYVTQARAWFDSMWTTVAHPWVPS